MQGDGFPEESSLYSSGKPIKKEKEPPRWMVLVWWMRRMQVEGNRRVHATEGEAGESRDDLGMASEAR